MSLAELVIVLDLLLKFARVTADTDDDKDTALRVAQAVAKKLVDGWGAEESIQKLSDIPF